MGTQHTDRSLLSCGGGEVGIARPTAISEGMTHSVRRAENIAQEPDSLGVNPAPFTSWLSNLGQIPNLPVLSVFISQMGIRVPATHRLSCRVDETVPLTSRDVSHVRPHTAQRIFLAWLATCLPFPPSPKLSVRRYWLVFFSARENCAFLPELVLRWLLVDAW